MAGEGMDTGAGETVSRSELAAVQQDLALAAASFNEMKAKFVTLEAQQLQQAPVRESSKSTAHANKPQPFSWPWRHDAFGLLIFSLRTYLEATNADPSRWVALGSTCLAESADVWYEHRVSDMLDAGLVDT
jgi:hypothetical protein